MDMQINKQVKKVYQVRDLTVMAINGQRLIVIAVDSDGGIGELEHDAVHCSAYELGRFAIRVPLTEILCCGATPVAAFDMLTVPLNQYGKEILRGIRAELAAARLPEDFPLSGSTEDNVPTTMTGIGTTIIGTVDQAIFKPGNAQPEDYIFCIGLPKSAPQDDLKSDDTQIVRQEHLLILNDIDVVHDILPVGSKGVAWEAGQLATSAGLKAELLAPPSLDLKKSGGPNTCVLIAADTAAEKLLRDRLPVPVTLIGKVRS